MRKLSLVRATVSGGLTLGDQRFEWRSTDPEEVYAAILALAVPTYGGLKFRGGDNNHGRVHVKYGHKRQTHLTGPGIALQLLSLLNPYLTFVGYWGDDLRWTCFIDEGRIVEDIVES